MRVLVITQDEPIFLPGAIAFLLSRLPVEFDVVGLVLLEASPFGGRIGKIRKVARTISVFGLSFVLRYAFMAVMAYLRGNTVRSVAKRHEIPAIHIRDDINSQESVALLAAQQADVIVSISGNQVFKKRLIELPRLGVLNLHTSRLPKYRGLMPSFWVLANGETETAVTVFVVDPEIDNGPILVQEPLRIAGRTMEQLIRDTKYLGMEAIRQALLKLARREGPIMPNDKSHSTYFRFPTRQDVKQFLRRGARFY